MLTRSVRTPMQDGHVTVLHHRPDEQAQRRLGQQQPRAEDDEDGEHDDEHAVVTEKHVA